MQGKKKKKKTWHALDMKNILMLTLSSRLMRVVLNLQTP
jgi:hypothetical protein